MDKNFMYDRFGKRVQVGSQVCFSIGQAQTPDLFVGVVTEIKADAQGKKIVIPYTTSWGGAATRTIREHQVLYYLIVLTE